MDDQDEKGASIEMGIAVLGLLIVIGVLVIKFVRIDAFDPFLGIPNPRGEFGEYFLTGIGIGIIVMLIGGALSMKKKKEPAEKLEKDLEKELEELEEEIEEEGICPTCGAVIPIDADECPECGEELEPPEEEEFEVTPNCPICGAEVSSDADECPECGEPLGEESEEGVSEGM